jgi:hypothetical protein
MVIGLAALMTAIANRRAARFAEDDLARRRDHAAWEARLELLGPGSWRHTEADRVVVITRQTHTLARAVVEIVARTPCRAARRARATVSAWDEVAMQHTHRGPPPRDIKLGDPVLDPLLRILGDDEDAVRAVLSPAAVRDLLRETLRGTPPAAQALGLDDEGIFVRAERNASDDATDAALAARVAGVAMALARVLDDVDAALPVRLGDPPPGATGAGGSPFAVR